MIERFLYLFKQWADMTNVQALTMNITFEKVASTVVAQIETIDCPTGLIIEVVIKDMQPDVWRIRLEKKKCVESF